LIPGGPQVTALGGGHGLAVTLAAARRYAGAVTAVVSVADDGGSSGRLREMTGIPAPGDLRRCLGALADPTSVWTRAFEYRFPADGELAGHALGNLMIAVLTEVSGDFATALEYAARLLQVEGRVLPATTVPVDLVARVNGADVVGQVKVAHSRERIERLSLSPPGAPSPAEAVEAVVKADQVLLGPGSLYTSVLASAVVPDLAAAVGARHGGRVFVANLRADEPEARGYRPADQLRVLLDHGVVVDVMVYDPAVAGPTSGRPARRHLDSEVDGVRCVPAAVAQLDGTAHDPRRLASVLADLAAGPGVARS
jgi:uncharacterized cofD-like protein